MIKSLINDDQGRSCQWKQQSGAHQTTSSIGNCTGAQSPPTTFLPLPSWHLQPTLMPDDNVSALPPYQGQLERLKSRYTKLKSECIHQFRHILNECSIVNTAMFELLMINSSFGIFRNKKGHKCYQPLFKS